MTNWLPSLSAGSGPLYVRLAAELESAIGEGQLPAGAKLPPQRNLAFDIGVTVGTVGRAYSILRQRGLVSGEVGRGTYVLGQRSADSGYPPPVAHTLGSTRSAFVTGGKLPMDTTAALDVGQAGRIGELAGEIARQHPAQITSYVRNMPASWLDAGSRWLAAGEWAPDPELIVPTLGAHAAVLAVIAAVTAPGDKIAFEHLTYSSITRSAYLFGRRCVAMEADEGGLNPEDFDRVCAQQHPKAAFLIPSLHNPTLTIMSEDRRSAIAEVARKHNVWLIEDAIYAALLDEQPISLAELAPERTFHVGSLSKSVAAGIRGGWVACPPHFAPRVLTAHKMVTGGMPFLLAELSARLVLSGEADAIRARVRRQIEGRVDVARASLDGYEFRSHGRAPFLWVRLPEPWLSATFKQAAANEGVLIDDEDEFKCGRTERSFHRVRIGLTAPALHQDLVDGLAKLRSLLDSGMAGYDSYG
ncbi:MAG TPA: PLP-dependent aminotransferase family protein [Afifellaceae bacterium]|nr:PLP-dependent aminotransferase family protein [Afifellaceae bacterium]